MTDYTIFEEHADLLDHVTILGLCHIDELKNGKRISHSAKIRYIKSAPQEGYSVEEKHREL